MTFRRFRFIFPKLSGDSSWKHFEDQVKVIENQIQNFLNRKEEHKFDIFFLDPPFADINYLHNLKMIRKSKIYNEKHIVTIAFSVISIFYALYALIKDVNKQ